MLIFYKPWCNNENELKIDESFSKGLIDFMFNLNFPFIVEFLNNKYSISITDHESIDLGFAPEIWGGVLAMVLGTLIIVIAIAAESSPKLMDLFVKDWLSLSYVLFLIISSLHAVVIMFYVLYIRGNIMITIRVSLDHPIIFDRMRKTI